MPHKDPKARKEYQKAYAQKNKAYARVKAWRKNNPEKVAEQNKRYAENHPEKVKAKLLRSKWKNIDIRRAKDREASAKYRENNKTKVAAHKKKYAVKNKGKVNAAVAKRNAAKLLRTPKWLTKDDLWVIEQAYELAAMRTKMFGFAWHVDHVFPLQGKTVSGLHVPVNLQVIPGVENMRKGNRLQHG